MKLGGKMSRFRDSYRTWRAAGGDVEVCNGGHLRWTFRGRLAFFTSATGGLGSVQNVRSKVKRFLSQTEAKPQ